MHPHQAIKKDTTLHLKCSKVEDVSKFPKTDIKIVTFNKVVELSPKEEFCCNQATD